MLVESSIFGSMTSSDSHSVVGVDNWSCFAHLSL